MYFKKNAPYYSKWFCVHELFKMYSVIVLANTNKSFVGNKEFNYIIGTCRYWHSENQMICSHLNYDMKERTEIILTPFKNRDSPFFSFIFRDFQPRSILPDNKSDTQLQNLNTKRQFDELSLKGSSLLYKIRAPAICTLTLPCCII